MIYSKTCEYAIRSLIFFANHPHQPSATVRQVSRETGVPQAYVAKIFQCLVHCKILRSLRGPAGGYSLAIPLSKLTLIKIVRAMDDLERSPFSNCIMGLHACNDRNPCPLHHIWTSAKEKMLEKLTRHTISDVVELTDKFDSGKHKRFTLSKKMRDIFNV
jgi:Rrf2 family protein